MSCPVLSRETLVLKWGWLLFAFLLERLPATGMCRKLSPDEVPFAQRRVLLLSTRQPIEPLNEPAQLQTRTPLAYLNDAIPAHETRIVVSRWTVSRRTTRTRSSMRRFRRPVSGLSPDDPRQRHAGSTLKS